MSDARKFTLFDFIIIALLAAAGIVIKPYVSTAVHFISAPLMMPGGTLAGGLYMLWLVLAYAITGKHGSSSLVGFVQAVLVMILGFSAMPWIITFVSYTASGVAADATLLLTAFVFRIPFGRLPAFLACIAANVMGTLVVGKAIFALPGPYLLFTLLVAALSGGIGGIIAWELARLLKKSGLTRPQRRSGAGRGANVVRAENSGRKQDERLQDAKPQNGQPQGDKTQTGQPQDEKPQDGQTQDRKLRQDSGLERSEP